MQSLARSGRILAAIGLCLSAASASLLVTGLQNWLALLFALLGIAAMAMSVWRLALHRKYLRIIRQLKANGPPWLVEQLCAPGHIPWLLARLLYAAHTQAILRDLRSIALKT